MQDVTDMRLSLTLRCEIHLDVWLFTWEFYKILYFPYNPVIWRTCVTRTVTRPQDPWKSPLVQCATKILMYRKCHPVKVTPIFIYYEQKHSLVQPLKLKTAKKSNQFYFIPDFLLGNYLRGDKTFSKVPGSKSDWASMCPIVDQTWLLSGRTLAHDLWELHLCCLAPGRWIFWVLLDGRWGLHVLDLLQEVQSNWELGNLVRD